MIVLLLSINSINTSAKSKVSFQYDSVSLAKDRNFVATGNAAIKKEVNAGNTVVSKTTMKKIANSKNPSNIFRAYYRVNMKNGATYYKVVSMNGKYRGFVKSNGIKQINTLTQVEFSKDLKNQPVILNNTSKNRLWESPKDTQYQIGVKKYSDDQLKGFFKVDRAVRTTVGNKLYYHVTLFNNKSVHGYVYAGKGYLDNRINSSFGGLSLVAR